MNALYTTELYNGNQTEPGFTADLTAYIIGMARLRQLRVGNREWLGKICLLFSLIDLFINRSEIKEDSFCIVRFMKVARLVFNIADFHLSGQSNSHNIYVKRLA